MSIILQGFTTILAADFVSGFVHWAEDACARQDPPVTGKLIANANIEHHKKPRAFVERNWLESSWDLLTIGTLVIATACNEMVFGLKRRADPTVKSAGV